MDGGHAEEVFEVGEIGGELGELGVEVGEVAGFAGGAGGGCGAALVGSAGGVRLAGWCLVVRGAGGGCWVVGHGGSGNRGRLRSIRLELVEKWMGCWCRSNLQS